MATKNYNPDVLQRAKDILKLGGQDFPNVLGDQIIPIIDVTPLTGDSVPATKITDGTDILLINSDGSLNTSILPSGGTLYTTDRIVGTGADQTLFTATSGKTAYVTNLNLFGAGSVGVSIKDHAGTIKFSIGVDAANKSFNLNAGGGPIMKVNSGETLKANGPVTAYMTVTYIEV